MTCASSAEVDWAMARGAVLAPISMMADRAPTTADSVLSWSLLRRVLLCGRRFLLQARCVPSRSHHIEMTEISQRVGPLRVIRVIPANPAFPVRPKSGHSANDPRFYEYAP